MAVVSKQTLALALLAGLFVLVPLQAHATASGPAGPIVYVDGGGNIAVISSSGTGQHSSAELGSSPTWAPASTQIAFVRANQIRIMTYNGSGGFGASSVVANTTGTVTSVAWGPNGQTLAYSNGTDIFSIKPDGSANTQLTFGTAPGNHNDDPAWSPDGSEIAFETDRDGGYNIYRMGSDGSNQTKLTTGGGDDKHPSWSPDGTTIVFESNRDNVASHQLYKVPVAGGLETRLTNNANDDSDPSWAPTGSQFVLVQGGSVATSSSSGGSITTLVTGTQPEWGLSFGPLTPPTISPNFGIAVGATLTASDGTWSATPTSFSYQWQRCNSAGSSCLAISGATSKTYTVTDADNGSTLRVTVTATVSGGSGSSTSAATSLIVQTTNVAGAPPSVVEVPSLFVTPPLGQTPPAGQILVGSTFSAGVGTWRGQSPLTFTYQWKKCDAGGSCFAIPGATTSTFTPGADLFNWRIAVGVTATNVLGTADATSQPWGPLVELPPVGSITPPITGSNIVGQTLSVGTGTFTGTQAFTYAYQWRRCDAPGTLPSCVPISGATSASYVLQQLDMGSTIRAYITATNAAGSATLITNHTFPILPKPKFSPLATTPPSILGNPIPGRQLQLDRGTWSGDAPITYVTTWERCDATGAACTTVSKKRTYDVTNKDASLRLRVKVTATNDNGTVSAFSGLTEPIMLTQPHRKGRTIRGTDKADYLAGGGFDDTIYGLGGNDTILGGAGDDTLYGGPGADVIIGGPGSDHIYGGPGNDTIMAADGERDVIDCGPGNDRAVVDAIDVVSNCETVQVAGGSEPTPTTSSTTTTRSTSTTTSTSTTSTSTTSSSTSTSTTTTTTPR